MRRFFGTDGIRGLTNKVPMTAEVAMRVGMAAGAHFLRGDHKHRVVIGKDTRLSGYMLENALVAGFTSVGMDVVRTNIEQIGGVVDVASTAGRGSHFSIKIPLTLAIVSALIVGCDEERFAIPQLAVRELVRELEQALAPSFGQEH